MLGRTKGQTELTQEPAFPCKKKLTENSSRKKKTYIGSKIVQEFKFKFGLKFKCFLYPYKVYIYPV